MRGRKTKYQEDFPKRVEELAAEGLNDYQIWEQLGISHDAFYRYCREYNELYEALKRGRRVRVQKAENALFKKATGYDYEEETKEVKIDDQGNTKPVAIKTLKRHVPPDTGALAFFLKNQAPGDWADTYKNELTGKNGDAIQLARSNEVDISNLNESDVAKLVELGFKVKKDE